jgi:pimeloyl-ACP methyl ester carboxylesterase
MGGSMQKTMAVKAAAEKAPKIAQVAASVFAGKVLSKDGTVISFEKLGYGWPVILVDGALCYRGMGRTGQLAELLAHHFAVYTYDRRGRGDSGDTAPYSMEREIEDIAALLREAGGEAFIWGMSSGAVLAMEAANRLRKPRIVSAALRSWHCTRRHSSWITAVAQPRTIGSGSVRRLPRVVEAMQSSTS